MESDRTPPYEVICGNLAQMARCTRIASRVRPDSTPDPVAQGLPEMPLTLFDGARRAALLAGARFLATFTGAGLVSERY
jgi:hypothetical protein